jgi:hypothetical protein
LLIYIVAIMFNIYNFPCSNFMIYYLPFIIKTFKFLSSVNSSYQLLTKVTGLN